MGWTDLREQRAKSCGPRGRGVGPVGDSDDMGGAGEDGGYKVGGVEADGGGKVMVGVELEEDLVETL